MRTKTIDRLFIGIVTIGTGATVFLLSTSKKLSAVLLASTTGAVGSLYVVKSQARIESKLDTLINIIAKSSATSRIESDNVKPNSSEITSLYSRSDRPEQLENSSAAPIIQWLESLEITVSNYYQSQAYDYIYDHLTISLGENYEYLDKLYQKIKRRLSNGNNFQLSLIGKNQREIYVNTSFCSQLYEYAFLTSYRYSSNNKTIFASPNRTGQAINFFSGQWFERFVYLKVSQLLSQQSLSYQYLLNPEILTPDSNNFELDIVFFIEEEPLWIECKTGQYQNYINKYSLFRQTLKISKEKSFLVILGISDRLASELTEMYDLMVSNEKLFVKDISQALNIDYEQHQLATVATINTKRTIKIKSKTIRNKHELLTVFKKAKLRPSPKWRALIIQHLIDLVSDTKYIPLTIKILKDHLFDLTPGISKTLAVDIINALILGKCILEPDGNILYSYHQYLGSLVSDRLDFLNSKCLEVYALITLLTDTNYFDIPSNIKDFQAVVGTDNLDELNIQAVKNLASNLEELNSKITTANFVIE